MMLAVGLEAGMDSCRLIWSASGICRWLIVPRLCFPRLLNELVSPLGPKITPVRLACVVSLPLTSGMRATLPALTLPDCDARNFSGSPWDMSCLHVLFMEDLLLLI
jgi:hypothetical protein